MLNKNVCPNCGQLYDTELARCPLCGTAPQVVETDTPVQRKRITEAERRQRRLDRKEAEQEARRRRKDAQFMKDAEEERRYEEEEARRKEEKRRRKEEKKAARRGAKELPLSEEEEAPESADAPEAPVIPEAPQPEPMLPQPTLPEEGEPEFTPGPAQDGRGPMPEVIPQRDPRRVPRAFLVLSALVLLCALVVGGSYLLWKLDVVELPIYDRLAADQDKSPVATGDSVATEAAQAQTQAAGTEAVSGSTEAPIQTQPPQGMIPCKSVTLGSDQLDFTEAGAQLQLAVTLDPADTDQELSYLSSDEAVVKVSPVGIVTAVAPGSAVITVRCGTAQAECAVVCDFDTTAVTSAVSVDVDKLELVKDDMTFFAEGENYVLSVTNVPAGTPVTWASLDETVATVDQNGHVVAVGPGTTRVVATVGDKSAECWVRCRFE